MATAQRGYYSLVQYCPDDSRLESVNVGLALFLPEIPRIHVRWAANSKRIVKLFGSLDLALFEQQRNALGQRLNNHHEFLTRDSINQFAETRAGAIRLTAPRNLKFFGETAQECEALFKRLVPEHVTSHRACGVINKLRAAFEELGVAKLVDKHVKVTVSRLNRQLIGPYAYQNGRYNLLLPQQFELSKSEQVLQKASMIAVEGQYLFEERDQHLRDMALVLVANFAPNHEQDKLAVRDIMQRHNVKMFTFDDMTPLIDDIRESALKHGKANMPLT